MKIISWRLKNYLKEKNAEAVPSTWDKENLEKSAFL